MGTRRRAEGRRTVLTKKSDRQARRGSLAAGLAYQSSGAVDRRTFLRRSGLAAGGLAALGTLPLGTVRNAEAATHSRSEEHTSELQSLRHLVCRLLLEKKK